MLMSDVTALREFGEDKARQLKIPGMVKERFHSFKDFGPG